MRQYESSGQERSKGTKDFRDSSKSKEQKESIPPTKMTRPGLQVAMHSCTIISGLALLWARDTTKVPVSPISFPQIAETVVKNKSINIYHNLHLNDHKMH
ncbi:hypothetical protein RUM43_000433 [Polyplax serrata]|uniref:Uncharacterized protein n=1 Tax=Polyplax serrata TaxID=468196 RepID=A0AAN8SE06_POLSC